MHTRLASASMCLASGSAQIIVRTSPTPLNSSVAAGSTDPGYMIASTASAEAAVAIAVLAFPDPAPMTAPAPPKPAIVADPGASL